MNKIFGIGLSKTGTTSLSSALSRVGIKITHYPKDKNILFSSQSAGACDIPVVAYYKELDTKFLNCKFIYTIREKEEWLISVENDYERKKHTIFDEWATHIRTTVYGQMEFDRDVYSKRYDSYDEEIKLYFKGREQDLLVLNICAGDKLEKLYSFIRVSNKNASKNFPRKNDIRSK